MLSLFRTNQILVSSFLLIYAAVLHLAGWYIPDTWEPQGYGLFAGWIYQWIGSKSTAAHLLVILLVVIQAITVNVLDFSNKLSREQTLFPGVFLVLLSAMAPVFLHLAPYHLANTFLLFALSELMQVYRKTKSASQIFNTGFFLGIAFMFVPSYWVFLFFLFAGLNALRSFDLRERLMVVSGFFSVLFLTGTVYFLLDRWPEFLAGQFGALSTFLDPAGLSRFGLFHLIVLAVFLIVALLRQQVLRQKRIMQTQKKIDLLYWMLLFGGVSALFQENLGEEHALAVVPALGVLTGMQISAMEKRTAELVHLLLFLLALFFQYRVFLGIY